MILLVLYCYIFNSAELPGKVNRREWGFFVSFVTVNTHTGWLYDLEDTALKTMLILTALCTALLYKVCRKKKSSKICFSAEVSYIESSGWSLQTKDKLFFWCWAFWVKVVNKCWGHLFWLTVNVFMHILNVCTSYKRSVSLPGSISPWESGSVNCYLKCAVTGRWDLSRIVTCAVQTRSWPCGEAAHCGVPFSDKGGGKGCLCQCSTCTQTRSLDQKLSGFKFWGI